jgi:hypothetical protein
MEKQIDILASSPAAMKTGPVVDEQPAGLNSKKGIGSGNPVVDCHGISVLAKKNDAGGQRRGAGEIVGGGRGSGAHGAAMADPGRAGHA